VRLTSSGQLPLSLGEGMPANPLSLIAGAFDPDRLTQARRLAGMTKRAVADEIGITAVAVGQWESGSTIPRPDHIGRLAEILDVPAPFFALGRPHGHLDGGTAHFRSLRRTPAIQRARAVAFAEQVWELAYALEKRVELPPVNLPGFSAGEISPDRTRDPILAARALREHWGLGTAPIPYLVRTMERHGLLVTLVPFAGSSTATVDAFCAPLPRPIVVLTPDRARDIYRHRFTAAHEIGHLLIHGDSAPGDLVQEREADTFAAELLTPAEAITPLLPKRFDLAALEALSKAWGVGVESLIRRCREVEVISEASYRRAFLKLGQMLQVGLFRTEPVSDFPGEIPVMLRQAFGLAEQHGLTMAALADELSFKMPRLRLLLGETQSKPKLRLA